jgi:hypothetical protein|eukprot:XP_017177378.1 PREDICTED: uncharacterized protein LOC108169201 [Mus musculus]
MAVRRGRRQKLPVRSRGRGRGRGGAAGRERAGGQARANEPGRAPGSPRAIERRWHGCEAGRAEPKGRAGRRRGPSAARGEPSGRASGAGRERGALARSRRPELRGGGGHNFVCACLGVRAWVCARRPTGPGSASGCCRQQSRCRAKCLHPSACGLRSSRHAGEMTGGSGRVVLPGECRGSSLNCSGKTQRQDGRLIPMFGEPSPPSSGWEGPT